jgi:hypothetical protein
MSDPTQTEVSETLAALGGLEEDPTPDTAVLVAQPAASAEESPVVVVDDADPVIAAARAAAAEPEAGIGANPTPEPPAREKKKRRKLTPLELAAEVVRRAEVSLLQAQKNLRLLQKKEASPQQRPRDIASLNKRINEITRQEASDRQEIRDFMAKFGLGKERKRPMPRVASPKE